MDPSFTCDGGKKVKQSRDFFKLFFFGLLVFTFVETRASGEFTFTVYKNIKITYRKHMIFLIHGNKVKYKMNKPHPVPHTRHS